MSLLIFVLFHFLRYYALQRFAKPIIKAFSRFFKKLRCP